MNRITTRPWLQVVGAIATVLPWTTGAASTTTVVVGTGNAITDVAAVQAAVNQGGNVFLKGHFSFDLPPTVPIALAGAAGAGYPPLGHDSGVEVRRHLGYSR
jgi:hypothetical protein